MEQGRQRGLIGVFRICDAQGGVAQQRGGGRAGGVPFQGDVMALGGQLFQGGQERVVRWQAAPTRTTDDRAGRARGIRFRSWSLV